MNRRLCAAKLVLLAGAMALSGALVAPATAAPDVTAPQVSGFDFSPKRIDLSTGSKVVSLTARVTDESGFEEPLLGLLASTTTTQTQGFVWMNRVSGTQQDGMYTGSLTMPDNVASGAWRVELFPLSDTLGNSGDFIVHPERLMVRYGDAVPNAPAGVRAAAGPGTAVVSWSAPLSDQPITAYTVTSSPGGLTKTVDGSATTATFDGLTNGTAYTFRVIATSAVGDSAVSAPSNAVIPATVPDAPTNVVGTSLNGSVNVSWRPPPSNGGSPITGYSVTVMPGNVVVHVSFPSARIDGLTNGMQYSFVVTAINAIGQSAQSAASTPVTPAGPPDRVKKPFAKVRHLRVGLRWLQPDANGSRVTGYVVRWRGGSKRVASSQQSLKLQLRPGRYRFSVVALSGAGPSVPSPAVRVALHR